MYYGASQSFPNTWNTLSLSLSLSLDIYIYMGTDALNILEVSIVGVWQYTQLTRWDNTQYWFCPVWFGCQNRAQYNIRQVVFAHLLRLFRLLKESQSDDWIWSDFGNPNFCQPMGEVDLNQDSQVRPPRPEVR